jgi:hypothetical protein
MPNWCKNRIEIEAKSAADADFLISAFKGKEDEGSDFSFNSIIPRPKQLSIVQGSVTSMARKYLEAVENAKTPEELKKLEEEWREEVKDTDCDEWGGSDEDINFGKGYDAFVKYAQAVAKNISEFGSPTWYEWSIKNWGTKWDASSTQLTQRGDMLIFEFKTAWSAPIPIFEYIAEHFADHIESMSVNCVERGCGYYLDEQYI